MRPVKKNKDRSTLKNAPKQAPPDKALIRRYINVPELKRLINLADKDLKTSALIRIIYLCALRREEPGMLILDYAKEMHKTGRIYVHRGKGSHSGYVDLDRDTQIILSQWIEATYKNKRKGTDYIFPGKKGKGVTGRTVYNIYNRLATELRFLVELRHPHVLKRSRAQHLIDEMVEERGLDPWHALQAIAQLIGHASAQTTIQNYIAQSGTERQMAQSITSNLLRKEK